MMPFTFKKPKLTKTSLAVGVTALTTLSLGAAGGFFYANGSLPLLPDSANRTLAQYLPTHNPVLGVKTDANGKRILHNPDHPYAKHLLFTQEVYFTILEEFWQPMPEHQLVDLYMRAIDQLTGQPKTLQADERNWGGLEQLMGEILEQIQTDEIRQEFIVQTNDLVLANLEPFGRSRLFSAQDEEELTATVTNQAEVDHFEVLELEPGASPEEIASAFSTKEETLSQQAAQDPEAAAQLEQARQAFEVLGQDESRERFEQQGVDPTINGRVLTPQIYYLRIGQFSPNTVEELDQVVSRSSGQPGLDTLILDLRGNIGGAIDGLPYFLGPFIGPDRYAYQFFSRDKTIDYKTKTGWLESLVPFKKVVILIDDKVQSTGEVMAAVLKKYNVGVLVGRTTQGWGTVERVWQIENQFSETDKFSMFMVHSLTLRDDGQPVEGLGVEPMVDISQAGWQRQLYSYIPDQGLIDEVAELVTVR